ncbi:proline racemase family protein [Paracoccus sp. PXZ]
MRLDRMITVIGAHAEGDVGRVITGGFNPPRAASMFERMELMEQDHDWLRRLMLPDPRCSVNCAVNLLSAPIRADADIGMIVTEPDYYVPMSGGNLTCTVTVALETGFIPMQEPRTIIDTPAGLGRGGLRMLGWPVPPGDLPQCRVVRDASRRTGRGREHRRAQGRRRLWRDDLLHRRCARPGFRSCPR